MCWMEDRVGEKKKESGRGAISRGEINGEHSLSERKSGRLYSLEGMQIGTNTPA